MPSSPQKFPQELIPKILFEDANVIVLSKPAGLLSQGDVSEELNLVDWLREYFGRHYVGLVHRLDRNTSGLMVVAKRTKAASRLTEALQGGQVIRSYLAVLRGKLKKTERWKHWLLKDEKKNLTKVVNFRRTGAKKAILTVVPLGYSEIKGETLTLAKFNLETGRSHQIRIQAAAQKVPLVGDVKYGDAPTQKFLKRPALHSYTMSFPHPITKEILNFKDEYPEDFKPFHFNEKECLQ